MARRTLTLGVAASVVALAAGCGSSSESSTGTGAAAQTGGASTQAASGGDVAGKTVYMVSPGDMLPWLKSNNATVKEALEKEGVKVTYLQDPINPQQNVQNLDRAIGAKPDLILLNALDNRAVVPSLNRAKQAGIPVIAYSSPPAEGTEELFVSSEDGDHVALGRFAAENIVAGLKEEGKTKGNVIVITGTQSLTQVQKRMQGFTEEMAKHPEYKIVATEDGNWDQATTQKIAQQLFAKYRSQGGIQAAYGMADNQAAGIIQAAKDAGMKVGVKNDGLIVTGSNCYRIGLEAIKAGEQYGTATQSPVEEGLVAADMALKFLRGETLPQSVAAPETKITAENVDEILAKNICT
jgi:ABC-type sugar transport system substrate-binding protein